MRTANSRKCAEDFPLMKGQKPDVRFIRTPLMGEDIPIGGIKSCAVYAFPVLRDRPQCIAKLLHVAGNSIKIVYDLTDEFSIHKPLRHLEPTMHPNLNGSILHPLLYATSIIPFGITQVV